MCLFHFKTNSCKKMFMGWKAFGNKAMVKGSINAYMNQPLT